MFATDWLARREALTPDDVALVDATRDRRRITFREWNRSAIRTARWLRDRCGVNKGDRVSVLAQSSVAYLDVWFACAKLGAVLVNLNTRLSARELAAILAQATPKVMIHGPEQAAQIAELRAAAPSIERWVALEKASEQGDLAFEERDLASDDPLPPAPIDDDDPWVLCFTGGTTGRPKGAVLTHRAITANAINTVISWGLTARDTAILDAPLFHTGGLNVFTAPLVYVGGTSVLCRGFDEARFFDLVESERATLYFAVPTVFLRIAEHARFHAADLSRLRLVISGGAPCPLPLFERYWARGLPFRSGYGLTEAGPNNFGISADEARKKPGSVGAPLMHVTTLIARADGTECAPEEVGELLLRGPHLCAGYDRNPEATAAAFHPRACDPSGPVWLHTGDLARRDADGAHYIVGRSKDMFISGGENVYPAEIESVLHGHPRIAEAAVIGAPDAKWGEIGVAFVVARPVTGSSENEGDLDLSEEALRAFVRASLAGYKVPKRFVIASELPKTGAGKIDKKLLLEGWSAESR
ncbi:MAG: long-chain fatty acid--CoA ligase [Polyangiaceae bacterium]